MLDMARGDEERAQRNLTAFELSCAILTCAYRGGHCDSLQQASFFGIYFSFCFCLYLASLSKRRHKGWFGGAAGILVLRQLSAQCMDREAYVRKISFKEGAV